MRKVIVNSTPLIILCGIGQLELLKKLYFEIYIPGLCIGRSLPKRIQPVRN